MKNDKFVSSSVIFSQRGFTLVELMVAMTLGIIIITASSLAYMNVEKMKRENKDLISLQQEARIGINKITSDVREGGAFGCANLGTLSDNGSSEKNKGLIIWQKQKEFIPSRYVKSGEGLNIGPGGTDHIGGYGVAFLPKEKVKAITFSTKGSNNKEAKYLDILSDGLVVQKGRGAAKYVAPSVKTSDGTEHGDVFMFSPKDDAFFAVNRSDQHIDTVGFYNGNSYWALSDCNRIELFGSKPRVGDEEGGPNRRIYGKGAMAGKLVFQGPILEADGTVPKTGLKYHPFVDSYEQTAGLDQNRAFVKSEATLSALSSNLYVVAELKMGYVELSGSHGLRGLWKIDLTGQDPSELIIPNAEDLTWKLVYADDCKLDDNYSKSPTYQVLVNREPDEAHKKMVPAGVYMSFVVKGNERGVPITTSDVSANKGPLKEITFSNVYMGIRAGSACANRTISPGV